jgi:two-component system response regulator CpxR
LETRRRKSVYTVIDRIRNRKGRIEDMERILLADDDLELCRLLEEYLGTEGLTVESVHDGAKTVERALAEPWALVILDVMLPSMNGLDVLRSLRGGRSSVPILMLTARGDEVDRIVGLELGADDYLPKPFNPRELVARIRAILRRYRFPEEEADPSGSLTVGKLELDPGSRSVRFDGAPVELTGVEFGLLEQLMKFAGQVISRERLTVAVLKRAYSPFDRSLDVHVSNLRKKLGRREDGSEWIKTLRGEGYQFVQPQETTRS